jgi:hypothetical protein
MLALLIVDQTINYAAIFLAKNCIVKQNVAEAAYSWNTERRSHKFKFWRQKFVKN